MILETHDLHCGYGPDEIVHGIDVEVAEGSIVAILGPNGSGKSTFLKAVLGYLRVTGGGVRFAGRDIVGLGASEISALGIGYVPQLSNIFKPMTVLENLESESMMKGGQDGPVLVPGKPDQSLLVKAISYTDSRLKMPPAGKLQDDEIAVLETWVRQGAVWGDTTHATIPAAAEYVITPEQRAFWSFQPVRKPEPPRVKDRSWTKSPIDAFVLTKLEASGLKPVRPADKKTLIRRATMDLIPACRPLPLK